MADHRPQKVQALRGTDSSQTSPRKPPPTTTITHKVIVKILPRFRRELSLLDRAKIMLLKNLGKKRGVTVHHLHKEPQIKMSVSKTLHKERRIRLQTSWAIHRNFQEKILNKRFILLGVIAKFKLSVQTLTHSTFLLDHQLQLMQATSQLNLLRKITDYLPTILVPLKEFHPQTTRTSTKWLPPTVIVTSKAHQASKLNLNPHIIQRRTHH
jgi:hypothetical protein